MCKYAIDCKVMHTCGLAYLPEAHASLVEVGDVVPGTGGVEDLAIALLLVV